MNNEGRAARGLERVCAHLALIPAPSPLSTGHWTLPVGMQRWQRDPWPWEYDQTLKCGDGGQHEAILNFFFSINEHIKHLRKFRKLFSPLQKLPCLLPLHVSFFTSEDQENGSCVIRLVIHSSTRSLIFLWQMSIMPGTTLGTVLEK